MQESKQEQVKPFAAPSFRVWLCGALRVERLVNGSYEPIPTAEWGGSSYPRLLLKALLCCPGRQARREALMELLWPEAELEQAAQYLNTATTKLRSVLRPAKGRESLLMTENDSTLYRLEGQQLLWVDADEALALLKEAERLGHSAPEALRLLEEAATYFSKGTFLQEDEGLWASGRRATVERAGYQCRILLAEAYIRHGMPAQAGTVLSLLLEEDPTDEDVLCCLMELLHRQGMTHRALRAYEEFAKALRSTDQEPAESTTKLYQRLKHAPHVPEMPPTLVTTEQPVPQTAPEWLPTAMSEIESRDASIGSRVTAQHVGPVFLLSDRSPGIVWPSHHQHQALNLLYATPGALPDAQNLGVWIARGASNLALLFEAGWTAEEVLDALRLPLQMIEDMPPIVRQQFLHLSSAALMRGIPLPTGESLSTEEQTQLCASLGQSIAQSWKLFSRASTSQVLALGQAQLSFLQQVFSLIPSPLRAIFSSAVYRLIGAALFFQARYPEALKAHEQSYLAALEAGDPWNMAESLGWQSGVWKACGQQNEAIALTEAALRLLSSQTTPQSYTTQARLLVQWAESAALLRMPALMEEKLAASAALLDRLVANEEFDTSIWLYYNGTCAFYLGNFSKADAYFEDAFQGHHPSWIQQRAITTLFQAQARLHLRELEGSLRCACMTLPLITAVNSPLLSRGLIDYAESLHREFPHQPEVDGFMANLYPRRLLLLENPIPRYLEATL